MYWNKFTYFFQTNGSESPHKTNETYVWSFLSNAAKKCRLSSGNIRRPIIPVF
jgi:hypothetical protein